MPFVGEPDSDAVVAERPDFFDQAIVEIAAPFAGKERLDRGPALENLRPVPPPAVDGITERHPRRIARVLGILGDARLLRRAFLAEGG